MRSLVRVKRYHDTVAAQAAALAAWNQQLEERVTPRSPSSSDWAGCAASSHRRSPSWSSTPATSPSCESHRREITTVFTDLRGFTAFAETAEPEETMAVLAEYHRALGELVFDYEGTLEHFAGDGLMVFFNDPVPCPDAPDRAVRMAVDMRARVAELAQGWRRRDTTSASGWASRRATPRSAGSASRAATTTPPSAR